MSEFDGPWKVAVELFLEAFMLFLFKQAHADIDWTRKPESLDKELQAIAPQGETGRLVVDLLFKVWLKSGEEQWILIHIEIQSQRVSNFGMRMFGYNYRSFDRYKRPVASFAVFPDDDPSWRPNSFGYYVLGCKLNFEYAWKLRLIRGLYEGGLKPDDARQLLRLVYWMMDLPSELDEQLWKQVEAIEQEKQMPHLLPFELRAMERGMDEGRKEGRKSALLEAINDSATAKFGSAMAAEIMAKLSSVDRS